MNKILYTLFLISLLITIKIPKPIIAHLDPMNLTLTEVEEIVNTIDTFGEIKCDEKENEFVFTYIKPSDGDDKFFYVQHKLQHVAKQTDAIYNYSASKHDEIRHINFDTDESCKIKLNKMSLLMDSTRLTKLILANAYTNWLISFQNPNKKYVFIVESKLFCGYGSLFNDSNKKYNANELYPTAAFVAINCLNAPVLAHEIAHTLGAVQLDSPFTNGNYHCWIEYEILCGPDVITIGIFPFRLCQNEVDNLLLLDCSGDSYFNPNPKEDSYLAKHLNIADSDFLSKE